MHLSGKLIKILFVSSVILICSKVAAQTYEQPIIKILNGARGQVKKDSSVMVEDDKWWIPSEKAKLDLTGQYRIKNIITLKINEDTAAFLKPKFTATVKFKLFITRNDGAIDSSLTPFLSITYDTLTGATYNSQSVFTFYNAYRVTAKIISVDSSYTPSNVSPKPPVTPFLRLENEMQIMREYSYTCTSASTLSMSLDGSSVYSNGEIAASWPVVQGATEYDLEWTFLDNESLLDPELYRTGGNYDAKKIFQANATRVTVTGTGYSIPMLYDNEGTLFTRFRPVQNKPDGSRFEGSWCSDGSGGMGQYANFTGHEAPLNWQATTSFAEDGKRKSVVQYYDGSLRARQTVTKDNTTNTTVVAETLYDFQGRPAIQVLPSPTLSSLIGYSKNFNRGLNGAYEKNLYDTLLSPSDYCLSPAPAMKTDSGAAKYYSSNNPLAAIGFNKYIPDAQGYAFTETRYTQDNTGRVLSQSGVGANHLIGSGHETKYYYGNPDQKELDGLFGTEVGYASHYFKNMVRDANGQYSVSYVDMHGRTIATALAGKTPPGMDSLASNIKTTITEKLSDSTNNITRDLILESSRSILVADSGAYVFNYSLSPDSLRIQTCLNNNICYDCLYNLEITITDECNNCHLPNNQPYVVLDSNFTFASIDTLCNTITGFNKNFTVGLTEGNYTITKRLSVSRPAFEYYRDSVFMKKNTCKTFADFYKEVSDTIRTQLDCSQTTCDSCSVRTASLSSFRIYYLTTAGIPLADSVQYRDDINQAYTQAVEECNFICGNIGQHTFIRKAMLLDMTVPTGQYANPDSAFVSTRRFNIFNPDELRWNSPLVTYHDEYGHLDSIVNSAGQLVPPNDPTITEQEYINNFKDCWANDLLPWHPEYDKLLEYEKHTTSHIWDEKFGLTDTYFDADSKGYLNPAALTGGQVPSHFTFNSGNIDPLAKPDSLLNGIMQNKVYTYHTEPGSGSVLSMWGMASVSGKCPNNNTCGNNYLNTVINNCINPATFCTGELDMAWRTFRQLYLTKKRTELMHKLDIDFPGVHPSIPVYRNEHFAESSKAIDDYILTISGQSGSTILSGANGQIQGFYKQNCESYATSWWTSLAPCNLTQTDSLRLIPRMVSICTAGSDATHTFGSSSTAPGVAMAYTSFESLIKHYIDSMHAIYPAQYNYDISCNAYTIYHPQPYNQQSALSNVVLWTKPDSCQCERITTLYSQYQQPGIPDTSFSAFLFRKTGTIISESNLTKLRNLCSGVDTCKFMETPISLPPVLQCGITDVCVTCDQVKNAFDSFKVIFPGILPQYSASDSLQELKNRAFKNYMNNKLGFTKQTSDYLSFMETCHILFNSDSVSCDSLNAILLSYQHTIYNSHTPNYDSSGCDVSFIRLNNTGWGYDKPGDKPWDHNMDYKLSEWMNNGIYGMPEKDTLIQPVSYFGTTFNYVDTLCLNNKFSFESRVKFEIIAKHKKKYLDNTGVPAFLYGRQIHSYVFNNMYINVILSQGDLDTGLPSNSLFANIVVRDINNNPIAAHYNISTGLSSSDNWMKLKLAISNNLIHLYLNGQQLDSVSYSQSFSRFDGMAVLPFGFDLQLDWLKMYDSTGTVRYLEDFNGCDKMGKQTLTRCNTNCQEGFVSYFNNLQGTAYPFTQIDSLYFNKCGVHPNPCFDTPNIIDSTGINCAKLDSLVNAFYNSTINPATRFADIEMRTFAGNLTPAAGPKGVFNVNGKLLGNTADGSVQTINNSFASIWNGDADNQRVGTLTALTNGKFRLALKPDAVVPCNGIIGQRYYMFDIPYDTLDAVITQKYSYVDFGDGQGIRIDSAFDSPLTKIFYAEGRVMTTWISHYHVSHVYSTEQERTVTVYHTDAFGLVGFDNWLLWYSGSQLPGLKNLRGYAPKHSIFFAFHSTQDSTLNTLDGFVNKDEIYGLRNIDFGSGDGGNTGFKKYNFNLKQFYNLKSFQIAFNAPVSITLDDILPNMPVNFPQINESIFGNPYITANTDFSLLKYRSGAFFNLTTAQVDQVLNQVSSTTLKDSGRLEFYYGQARSSASDAAISNLAAKHWSIEINSQNITPASYYNDFLLVPIDTLFSKTRDYPAGSMFTDYFNSAFGTSLTPYQVNQFYQAKCGHLPTPCSGTANSPLLCGKNEPLFPPITIDEIDPCADSTSLAFVKATELYKAYLDSLKNAFENNYLAKCKNAFKTESFTVTHPRSEYHYTLYYYDQAGNLLKTVPPEGVDLSTAARTTWLDSVAIARKNGTLLLPVHSLQTNYRYNTLNQVVAQNTPDAGLSTFYYDRLGRLVISQNAKQKAVGGSELGRQYSYTKYDVLGRIAEVGQLTNATSNAVSQAITSDAAVFNLWFNTSSAYSAGTGIFTNTGQVTRTVYDNKYPSAIGSPALDAKNLRNRVAYSTYTDGNSPANYNTATFYSYDIHGNVDTLMQDYGQSITGIANVMNSNSSRWKRIVYKYDLISGKVNHVAFQPQYLTGTTLTRPQDAFYHRYSYDSENRLTLVETSFDSTIWEKDARYQYYKHGPLARSIIGQRQVQGMDYAYTLQGWLKGVNSTTLSTTYDMGGDGDQSIAATKYIARDAFGYSLNYFTGDYTAISNANVFAGYSAYLPSGQYRPLYNGNISSMAVNIGKLNDPRFYNYKYDQLNRIKEMDSYTGLNTGTNTWSSMTASTQYKERISYDANGNILKYLRHGNNTGSIVMDSLSYKYGYTALGKLKNNKLEWVKDNVTASTYTTDIDNQSSANYTYDAIGNLITDSSENIRITAGGIVWNVYGKISEINKVDSTASNPNNKGRIKKITYTYDAAGNRISKRVVKYTTKVVDYTWYVRDASGNVMSIYNYSRDSSLANPLSSGTLTQTDVFLYGSSRLGSLTLNRNVELTKQTTDTTYTLGLGLGTALKIPFTRGLKQYELSNHLGNVLVTVSDKKIGITSNNSTVDYYVADVITANDYYPFGMQMPGRKYGAASRFRYGFNGKEEDDEMKGDGNSLDFGARIYDGRLARWLSVDPLQKKYTSFTPYNFCINSPLYFKDDDGRDIVISVWDEATCSYKPHIVIRTNLYNISKCANHIIIPEPVKYIPGAPPYQSNEIKRWEFDLTDIEDKIKIVKSLFEDFDLSPITPDAFVISVGGALVPITGVILNTQIVVMVKGSDAGNVYTVDEESMPFDNFGIDVGAGIEVGIAWHNSALEDIEKPNIDNFTAGDSFSQTIGVGDFSVTWSRTNVKGTVDLLASVQPQNRWQTLTFAGEIGPSKLTAGAIFAAKVENSPAKKIFGNCDKEPKRTKGNVTVGTLQKLSKNEYERGKPSSKKIAKNSDSTN